MGVLRSRASKVHDMVVEHLALVAEAVAAMAKGVQAHLDGRPWDEVEEIAVETHRKEARADDVRRAAEREMVRGALLAGTRRSLLDIVEGVDGLANAAEGAMYFLSLQRIAIPGLLHPLVQDAVGTIQEQMREVKAAVVGLLDGDPEVIQRAEQVERLESRVDELERRAISRLFATDLPLAEKILARQFLEKLGEISDRAEDISDLVVMAIAVRRP